jgi:hypothetical protein
MMNANDDWDFCFLKLLVCLHAYKFTSNEKLSMMRAHEIQKSLNPESASLYDGQEVRSAKHA